MVALVVSTALASCADGGVRTESATRRDTATTVTSTSTAASEPTPPTTGGDIAPPATTSPSSTAPSTTEQPTTAPPTPEPSPDSTMSSAPGTDDPVSTSAGDSLYPELGSADLDVVSYHVRLSYDPATTELEGTVTLDVAVARRLDELAIDASGLTIEAVDVDGEPASSFRTEGNELFIEPATSVGPSTPDDPSVVAITYRDDVGPSRSTAELPIGWFTTDGGSYVLNEPDGARTWLPSNDHPSDKASWLFEITVPRGTTAVANGTLVDQRTGPDGTRWVWRQDEPMPTYLLQVLTGDYKVLEAGRAAGVPITNVALARDVERMQPYFDLTDDQIEFFEPLFGPYPLDGYGLAFTDSFPGLAMETQGRSLFSREDFGGEVGYIQQLLLSHELAHQWFGNAVSPARWQDLWLNESFASYAQWLWFEEIGFDTVASLAASNLQGRQLPTEPTAQPTAATLFGYERYDGGAVVLHALRRQLGDDAFFRLLRRWVADNDGTSRTTDDFVALAEEVGETDLDRFRADWIDAAALPSKFPS